MKASPEELIQLRKELVNKAAKLDFTTGAHENKVLPCFKTATVLEDCGLTNIEFSTNMTYTAEMQHSIFMENLPMYGGMVLVFLAGFLIIFNVFQISVASDIQFYGKLKTLGMTRKQIRKLIYGQGNRLSLIGIPAGLIVGYLLGIVLVPALITTTEVKPNVSANPVIFIGSAVFSYMTVIASCMLPAHLAGKVSPMEALRYTDIDTNGYSRKCNTYLDLCPYTQAFTSTPLYRYSHSRKFFRLHTSC